MTAPALPMAPDEDRPPRPPKVRLRPAAATLLQPAIVRHAALAAFAKPHPCAMIRIPVMFVVEIGSLFTTVEFAVRPSLFTGLVTLWLWATVLFANFAEAVAEGRGKAQADTLRRGRRETTANRLRPDGTAETIPSSALSVGDRCVAGSLAGARVHARTRATLDTGGVTFAAFLVGVIVIVGGLIYFPMLIFGPVGERIVAEMRLSCARVSREAWSALVRPGWGRA